MFYIFSLSLTLVGSFLLSTTCLVLTLHFYSLQIVVCVLIIVMCICWSTMVRIHRVSSWCSNYSILPRMYHTSLFVVSRDGFYQYIILEFNFVSFIMLEAFALIPLDFGIVLCILVYHFSYCAYILFSLVCPLLVVPGYGVGLPIGRLF